MNIMNNFKITKLHIEALTTMFYFLPIGETDLRNDLMVFAYNARLAIANTEKPVEKPTHNLTEHSKDAAVETLLDMGYTYSGGSRWKPPYPKGDVIGPCICGSWPGGKCLECKWSPSDQSKKLNPND